MNEHSEREFYSNQSNQEKRSIVNFFSYFATMKPLHTNALIHETSPYLLQHAHNPVQWLAWNDEAWAKAKAENKLVIVSIGYSACHWCHVMERESFEDNAVAEIMNKHFISIKVDREERPDVDQIYMDAVQLITGKGGWPLNAIVLPDGRPIYAGTYFPMQNWLQVLQYFIAYWQDNREEALERATQITAGIKQMDDVVTTATQQDVVQVSQKQIFENFDATWDYEKGGRRGAPKFAMPVNLQYLLQNHFYTGNSKTLQAVTVTLNNMMNGGLYDHVGGGFARYSVDENWEIPHFEKMLYDNAQLVSLYSEAYLLAPNERYKETVYETLAFVERELSDDSGGFYSAIDADSEAEEGKYYVWDYHEIKEILEADFDEFTKVFMVSPQGNFEGKNHLQRSPEITGHPSLYRWKQKLLAERNKRIRPLLDDKMLCSWNALMLKALADAYRVFKDEKFLQRALQCAGFLRSKFIQDDYSVMRNCKNNRVTINGFLDDYSFTCEALWALYQVTFNEDWLLLTKNICDYAIQHFYNANTGLFFYTSVNDTPLIARKTETSDNVIPSSNSVLCKVLFYLGALYEHNDYLQMSKRACLAMDKRTAQHPSYYANWAALANYFLSPPFEVVITGSNALQLKQLFDKTYLPQCIFAGTAANSQLPIFSQKPATDKTLIYVCQNKVCQLPVETVAQALNLISN